jgi:hypothetical protein
MCEKSLNSSKIEIFSWLHGFFYSIAFRLDSILNKQKIIKKIPFLVKMVKMASFGPNHKIFSGFVELKKKKKKSTKILRKDQI